MSGSYHTSAPPIIGDTHQKATPNSSITISGRGGANGKFVWSGRAVEEGTEESTAGSPTLHRRTSSFGRLGIEWTTCTISRRSEEDQLGTEKKVGAGSKWIAASEGSCGFGSCKAHDVGISPQENRSRSKEEMGEGAGGEEGGVDATRDRARCFGGGLFNSHRLRRIVQGNESCRLDSEVTLRAEGHRNIPRFPVRLKCGL